MPFNWAGGFAVALMDPNDREAGRNFYAKRARYPLTILSGRPRRRLPPPAALRSVGVPALPRLRRGGRVRIRKLRPPGGTEGGSTSPPSRALPETKLARRCLLPDPLGPLHARPLRIVKGYLAGVSRPAS